MQRVRHIYKSHNAVVTLENAEGETSQILFTKQHKPIISGEPVAQEIVDFEKSRYVNYMKLFKRLKIYPIEEGPCAVCLRKMEVAAVFLSCKHIFHRNCITQWFKIKPICPECRTPIVI